MFLQGQNKQHLAKWAKFVWWCGQLVEQVFCRSRGVDQYLIIPSVDVAVWQQG